MLELYDRVADAPDAVDRLRKFVLDLAVRGKLVDQDPADEPVSVLVERIEALKAQLAKGGVIRKPKPNACIDADELPIRTPPHWAWMRLIDIGSLAGGMTPSKNNPDYWEGSVVWLSPKDIKVDQATDSELKITEKGLSETRLQLYPVGSLFMVARSGILKRTFPVAINRVPAACNQDIKVLVPFLEGQEEYLQIMFRGLTDFLLSSLVKTGTTVQSLKYSEFAMQPFPIPPLGEQHRIVAKVNDLMALLDRLETIRTRRETTRNRLTTASLTRLTAPETTKADFRTHARFALDNLDQLTSRPEQIKLLGETIHELAVRGKLVEQHSSECRLNQSALRPDEAAEKFDERAFEKRAAEFDLPWNWTIEPLSRVAEHIVDCPHTTPKWTQQGVICVRTKQVRAGMLDLSSPAFVSEETYTERTQRLEPLEGDVLYIREGGILGLGCRIPPKTRLCMGQRLMLVRPNAAVISEFLELCLNSPWIADFAADRTTGGAAPRVNMSVVRGYPVPVPPLAEQSRIVEVVKALMSLCSHLETALSTTDAARDHLRGSLLHGSLASIPEC